MSRTRLAGAVGLSAAASGAGVALMATSAWLLSRAAEQPPVLYLMVAIVSVRALGLSRGVLRYLERLVGHDVALRAQAALRTRAYAALARGTWVGRRGGDLLSRLVLDVAAAQDRVVRVVVPVVAGALVVLGTSVALTVIAPAAGVPVLVAAVIGGGAVPVWAARRSAVSDQALAPLRGQLAGAVADATHAAPDLLAYGAGDLVLDRVTAADAALRRAEQRIALVAGVAVAAQWLCTGLAVTGALLAGTQAVAAGTLAPVLLAVLALTPLALHEVVATLPTALQTRTRTRSALARVDSVIDAAPVGVGDRPPGASAAGPGAITATGLSVGWPGGPVLVEGLDLTVRAGERVALVGPSGVGKTTVAATILGLLPPRGGQATVAGAVGYLAQDAYLFDTTVAENVRIGDPHADDRAVATALTLARVELDLDRLVGEHGAAVSGGEARRIALARLLLAEHPVLIIDEPTEHLDRPTADALVDDLWRTTADAAVLVITHDPVLIERCDRVVTLGATAPARSGGSAARSAPRAGAG